MRLLWTKRGLKRLQSAFDYIADNFYLDYAIRFDSDARNVAASLPANPQLGREAFPELDRPEIRMRVNHASVLIGEHQISTVRIGEVGVTETRNRSRKPHQHRYVGQHLRARVARHLQ